MVLGFSNKNRYADGAYENDVALGAKLKLLPNGETIRDMFPSQVPVASFDHKAGYLNYDGGWANAGQGLSIMISTVISLGGKVLPGKKVSKIIPNGDVRDIQCEDGTIYNASLVVIATGSWTPSTFLNLISQHTYGLATG